MTEWMKPGCCAVITGGANGIGLAAAKAYAAAGMSVVIADKDEAALANAQDQLGATDILAVPCDVSDLASVEDLRDRAFDRFGAVHCLMNNAGVALPAGAPWESRDALDTILNVNLMGVINGCQAFIPAMLDSGVAGAIINTGSKQGITRPPGNFAYNLSKAGVVAYTESVAHALRQIDGGGLTAHLLVPGFVYSAMVSRFLPEKPDGAWTVEETVDFMLAALQRGDFYILCPDNETPRAVDEKRIRWNADDIVQNRPALSRWHPDYADEFAAFMKDETDQ